ncbi:MAG: hypothetical protein ACD_30C00112G0049 [uncultured bacterium]|uniref:Small ribosomal subunit protein bS16 n=4 Tax=Candidatus Daviesiibacteriota TaxID=1752718 RepID=A0A0G0I348_9BACT|nr:MAG: hypothetical protein ACD_30C00112G0049 [uncultured bacterium]KKQ10531.1 MAG: 30S ribosomal protein S16 [Candidatus Daviesbacteria bacterium GW2011_GWB1_36_5]KKQ15274.1 MAG: 30S ribosomal protein S16 [Candidatus Daviesbacteria bacterium GW2011_GWA1_36_8]
MNLGSESFILTQIQNQKFNMLKIRLMRIGTNKRPFYRVVAVDERKKRTGGYLELLGTYNPLTEPKEIKLDQPKIDAWLKKGAQPSDGFLRIIGKAKQRPPRPAKKQKKESSAPAQEEPKGSEGTEVSKAEEVENPENSENSENQNASGPEDQTKQPSEISDQPDISETPSNSESSEEKP